MKAVFPCSYYLPETAASLYLTDNIIHACAEQNLEVDLYTPTPTRALCQRVQNGSDMKQMWMASCASTASICMARVKILF